MCADVTSVKPSEDVHDKQENGETGETKEKEEGQALISGEAPNPKKQNPFKLPAIQEYSKVLKEEKSRSMRKYKTMLKQPAHRKTPLRHLSPVNVLRTIPPVAEPKEPPPSPTSAIKNDPDFLQVVAKGEKLRNMENLTTFVNNKREMFLIQYMIGVKRDEMLRLVQHEREEEKRLTKAEKWLEEDAVKFSDYLRFNDREAVDSVKQAEMETKLKLEKASDIKKINIHIINLKSKISKLEDVLTEYKLYAKFLTSVAPQEWKEQKLRERRQLMEQKAKEQNDRLAEKLPSEKANKRVQIASSAASNLQLPSQSKKTRRVREKMSACTLKDNCSMKDHDNEMHQGFSTTTLISDVMAELQLSSELLQYLSEEEEDDKADLFFTDPNQLKHIFAELEEGNLKLIQKGQETEETLEEIQTAFSQLKGKMNKETKLLREQVATIERHLNSEQRKAKQFEIIAKLYSFGEFNEDLQEKMLDELHDKVESVFSVILGRNDANLNSIQMLTAIEAHLFDLLEALETMQPDKVEEALKIRARQRRALIREARSRDMREYLLQRKLRTLQKTGFVKLEHIPRKLMSRSAAPYIKKSVQKIKWKSKDDDETQYFFA